MSEYLTVGKYATAEYIVNRSRFIGYIKPVTSSEEAVDFISEIKAKHRDATHNVYAYDIKSPVYARYSDDGEPQGTAGAPVLDVIKKNGVTDCCLVVTRYFGGILLGAGGLVRAYSHTAGLALNEAGIVKMCLFHCFTVSCDYGFYAGLNALLTGSGAKISSSSFGEKVTVDFRLPEGNVPLFIKNLTEGSAGKVKAEKTGETFDYRTDI